MKRNLIVPAEIRKNLYALLGILLCILPVVLLVVMLSPPAEFLTPFDINKALIVWANTVGLDPWLRWLAYGTSLVALFIALRRVGALIGKLFLVPHLLLYLATFYFLLVPYSTNQLTGVPWLPTKVDFGYISEIENDPTRQFWIAPAENPKAHSDLNAMLRKHGSPTYRHYADAKRRVAFHRKPAIDLINYDWFIDTLALMVLLHALLIFRHYHPTEKLPVEDDIEDDENPVTIQIDESLMEELYKVRVHDILIALSPILLFVVGIEFFGIDTDISLAHLHIFALCIYCVYACDRYVGGLSNYLYLQQNRLEISGTSPVVTWLITLLRFPLLVIWWPVWNLFKGSGVGDDENRDYPFSTPYSSSQSEPPPETSHYQDLNDPSNRC
ncbi:MAG: hypothetical protein PHC51_05260 [bacterium]|nr:hypothetical protein [bacterium]